MCLLKECAKFVVLGFNLVFVLVGAALITLGTIYQVNYFDDFTNALPETYVNIKLIPILTIVVGSIIFLIAFFGCCGTIRNSPCLLTTYAVILLVIFILQIALGVFVFLEVKDKDDLRKNVKQSIDTIFTKYDKEKEVVNFIQQSLECCGTYGPEFWNESPSNNYTKPASCYEEENRSSDYFSDGCRDEFYEFLKDSAKIIGITILALSATEVIGATLSLCLANSVRNQLRRNEYY